MKNIAMLSLIKSKKVSIGAIHFSPSPMVAGFDSVEKALKRAQYDLDVFIDGGMDAVIFENNYDLPHRVQVDPSTVAFMVKIISQLRFKKNIPFGISVLWNDYRSALAIAKVSGADFVRIPVFVDTVRTDYGIVKPVAKKAIKYRHEINAQNIAIFADVQVKHAQMLNQKKTLKQSIIQAETNQADVIIVTGNWTGEAPVLNDLKQASQSTHLPIAIGSGANSSNIQSLLNFSNAVIVSTSLKAGKNDTTKNFANLKSFEQRIDVKKVKKFTEAMKKYEQK